jgi:phenylalanyl-tRNA synthetase beta chain
MRVPIDWLKDFVQFELSAEALAERLTMAGLEVEQVEETPQGEVLALYITPNRGDCLSIFGIAREVYALLGDACQPTPLFERLNAQILNPPPAEPGEVPQYARVEILDPDLCPRYAARVIREVRIAPSPAKVQNRLLAAGMRPINNIVDATNYVMLELGQPLHAFDLDTLIDHRIVVRQAREGEIIHTLDGREHAIAPPMLMICDAERPVAVAGIMGGAETEVTPQTRHILMESAHFSPLSIRRTARALDLRTESSYRFERFVDPNLVLVAQYRVCELIEQWTGVAAVPGVLDVYPKPYPVRELTLRLARAEELLGFKVEDEEAHAVLQRLNLNPQPMGERTLRVQLPLYRYEDLKREVDLVEELGRVLGYERIPESPPVGITTQGKDSPEGAFSERVRTILLSAGLQEIVSHTLEPANPLQLPPPVELRNPMSDELRYLRSSILSGLVFAADHNRRRGMHDLHLFEIGRVFAQDESSQGHRERLALGILMTGALHAPHWTGKPREADFYSLKGVVEHLLTLLGIDAEFVAMGESSFSTPSDARFHPGRVAEAVAQGRWLGRLGELHPLIQRQYELRRRVYLAEFDLEALHALAAHTVRYRSLPTQPPVLRDIAVIVSQEVPVGRLFATIWQAGGEWIESVRLFDRYTGAPVPEGSHSLAFSLVFRHPERTLTDEEVNARVEAIFEALQREHGAQTRR